MYRTKSGRYSNRWWVLASRSRRASLEGLPDHVRAFEYRHTPDPGSVECDLLPVLGCIRGDRTAQTQS